MSVVAGRADHPLETFGRPRLGDFIEDNGTSSGPKLRLKECPICALDPASERVVFTEKKRPSFHFLNEHAPDDIGRPMAELLPPRGDGSGE